jgi:transcriptional regulator with XRE-family HTH domain
VARGRVDPDRERRLEAFAQKLNRLMLAKGWNGQELADRASKFVPDTHKDRGTGKRYQLGRHLISSYARGANEPTEQNLNYIAKALGVKPEELLERSHGEGGSRTYATMTSSLDGRTRLIIDAEVEAETALKVLALIRNDPMAKRQAS